MRHLTLHSTFSFCSSWPGAQSVCHFHESLLSFRKQVNSFNFLGLGSGLEPIITLYSKALSRGEFPANPGCTWEGGGPAWRVLWELLGPGKGKNKPSLWEELALSSKAGECWSCLSLKKRTNKNAKWCFKGTCFKILFRKDCYWSTHKDSSEKSQTCLQNDFWLEITR